jgi:serine/threonine protein kinase
MLPMLRRGGDTLSFPRPYGRYVLEDRIAMGGMAEIFRAKTASEGFAKPVCIKRILPHFLESETFVTMFRDEAALAARLQHANVVQVFDFGEAEGMLYLAMELVDGADLRKLLDRAQQRGRRPGIGQAIQIAIEICRGLHHAHSLSDGKRKLGIVHRDISPHNVLISRAGEVKITDFGIAKASERATHTSTGVVKGKLSYMAPEQAEGGEIDHRVDQFATGIILWEILTGRRLFSGENEASILRRVLMCDVPPPSRDNAAVPDALEKIVMRALAPDPAARFADMRALEMELVRVLFAKSVDPAFSDLHAWVEPLLADEIAPRRTALMPNAHDVDAASNAPTDEDKGATSNSRLSSVDGVFTSSSEPRRILEGDGALSAAPTVVATGMSLDDADETIKVSPSPGEHTAETRTGVLAAKARAPHTVPQEEPPQSVPTVPARPSAASGASFDSSSEPVAFPRKTNEQELVATERVRREPQVSTRAARPRATWLIGGVVVCALVVVIVLAVRPSGESAVALSATTTPAADGDQAVLSLAADTPPAEKAIAHRPADGTAPQNNPLLQDDGPLGARARAEPVEVPATDPQKPLQTASRKSDLGSRAPDADVEEPSEQKPSGARKPTAGARGKERAETPKGFVFVDVPGSWAHVYEGVRRLGETPTRIELPVGKHRLRLVNPETGKEKTVQVTVSADKVTNVSERL